MDKVYSFRKRIINNETYEEFYINPRDIFLNGKLNSEGNAQNMYYLPFNELFVIIFDELIVIIDLKETITKCLKLINQINYENLYDIYFGELKSSSTTKNNLSSNLNVNNMIVFKSSENNKKIKNMVILENKSRDYSLCFFIEYFNQEFLFFILDDIRKNNLDVIFIMDRNNFESTMTSKIKADSNLNNSSKSIKINFSCLESEYNSLLKHIEINKSNFITNIFLSNVNLIVYKLFNLYSFSIVDCEKKKFKFVYFFPISAYNTSIINFTSISDNFSNIIFAQVTSDYEIIIDRFSCFINPNVVSDSIINHDSMFTHKIISPQYSSSSISFFDLQNFSDKMHLIFCKLDIIFIYKQNKDEFSLFQSIKFEKFNNSLIRYAFIMNNSNIYAFNNKGQYAYEKVRNSPGPDMCQNFGKLTIFKDVQHVEKFQNSLGFFILGTNAVFKINDFILGYFIPETLLESIDDEIKADKFFRKSKQFLKFSKIFIETNKKLFENLSKTESNKLRRVFFNFSLSEFLVLFYRNQTLISLLEFFDMDWIITHNNPDDVIFNEYMCLLIHRIKVYLDKLELMTLSNTSKDGDKNIIDNQNIDSTTYIIDQFKSTMSNSIDDYDEDYVYANFILNQKFKCDFCNSCFVRYNERTRSYVCEMDHLSFSCCVSFFPITNITVVENNFLICEDCDLVYMKNYIEMTSNFELNKIHICLVCQKIL